MLVCCAVGLPLYLRPQWRDSLVKLCASLGSNDGWCTVYSSLAPFGVIRTLTLVTLSLVSLTVILPIDTRLIQQFLCASVGSGTSNIWNIYAGCWNLTTHSSNPSEYIRRHNQMISYCSSNAAARNRRCTNDKLLLYPKAS